MTKTEVLDWIKRTKIVPVIRASSSDEALTVIECMVKGGIDVLEITMTVPGAVSLVAKVVETFGSSALVGAGTVMDAQTADACIDAGAKFVVSPVVELATIQACNARGIPVAAGALTPTEVVEAFRSGSDVVKVFPCDLVGGAAYLKSLKAPLPNIPMMPTGGITIENVATYLRAGAVAVGVGSSLVDLSLVREDRHNELIDRAKAFRSAAEGAN